MARKKTVLLMTVGTGVGGEEHKKSLAHGIMSSVEHHNPEKIIFFGSEESRDTIFFIEDELNEDYDGYEFIQIDNVDNFKEYFYGIKEKAEEFSDEKVIIDYTSGTKTMSVAAAFTSMVCHNKLVSVVGQREKGTVNKGTESIRTQNIYPVYDELIIEKVKDLFNSNRFEAGKLLLSDIVESSDKELYNQLFDIYYNFDNINYDNALKLFDENFLNKIREKWPVLSNKFSENRSALFNMKTIDVDKVDLGKKPWKNKKYRRRCYYILASLLNNAKRRFNEGKYDDAIARLYRSFELIAQIRLREKYNINTSKVDLDYLKKRGLTDEYLNTLDSCKYDLNDDVKIGLAKAYDLLEKLNDSLGIFYAEHYNEINQCSSFRNKSILAHGLNFQTKENYESFEKLVLDAASILTNDLEKYLNQTKFPNIR